MGVNKRGIIGAECDPSLHYFDRDKGNDLMEEFAKTGIPSNELLDMVRKLYVRLTQHTDYRGYDDHLKEDMISSAFYEFLKYGHNFKVNKARNGAYTFCHWNARNSFNREIKKNHYRHLNLQTAMSDEVYADEWHSLYNERLVSELNGPEDAGIDTSLS